MVPAKPPNLQHPFHAETGEGTGQMNFCGPFWAGVSQVGRDSFELITCPKGNFTMTKHAWLALVLWAFGTATFAAERIRVAVQSAEEQAVQDLLAKVCTSVSTEDFKAYSSCFTKTAQAKHCEKAADLFVSNDLEMELSKWVVSATSEDKTQVLVRYTMYRDGESTDHVSSLSCVNEGGMLLIDKETPRSNKANRSGAAKNPDALGVAALDCPNGRCRLPVAPVAAAPKRKIKRTPEGHEILEGVSMFNDANGNPDPNGIMWIDPKRLLRMFPEKYGVPPCAFGNCNVKQGVR